MDHQLDWQLSGPPPLLQIGSAIAAQVGALAREQLPDIADLFPFARVWNVAGEVHDDWVVVMISDAPSQQQLSMGDLSLNILLVCPRWHRALSLRACKTSYKHLEVIVSRHNASPI